MENENKDFLTDEEKAQKMQEDVSAKIADAAAEIKDEIAAANETDEVAAAAEAEEKAEAEEQDIPISDAFAAVEVEKKEKKSVNISVGALVGIIVGCVAVAAIVVFLFTNFFVGRSGSYGNKAEGSVVAKVDGEKITDSDLGYYIYAEAMNKYYEVAGETADGNYADFDWNQEVDGKKLADTIKENAYNNAIDDAVTISQGSSYLSDDEKWKDSDEAQVNTTVAGYVSQFGEDGFALRTRTMGLKSANQYARTYKTIMKVQTLQSAMEDDINKFMPEGVDLSNYTKDDRATVKHVLIKTTDPAAVPDPAATPDPDAVDDATGLATAQTVAEQAKSGTDFDQLMETYNKDTGETSAGYTFKTGEMVEEFEKAAFALKIDEVSDPVKSEFGYHVIKRLPGMYELQGYWKAQAKISENKRVLDKIDVAAIMADISAANDELEAQESANSSNSSNAGN